MPNIVDVSGNVLFKSRDKTVKKSLDAAVKKGINLRRADLEGANLRYANLEGANLWCACFQYTDLRCVCLKGISGYAQCHEIFQEIIREQKVSTFTSPQWSMIGQILVHRLCWDSIKKRYSKKFLPVLKVIADKGWPEYHAYYKNYLEGEALDENS